MILFFLFVLVFFLTKKNSFTGNFYALASIYFTIFFILPLFSIYGNSYYEAYSTINHFNDNLFFFALTNGFIFVLGFISVDFYLILTRKKKNFLSDRYLIFSNQQLESKEKNLKFIFYLLCSILFAYYLFGLLDTTRAIQGYASRQGESQGSWLTLLIFIIMKVVLVIILNTVKNTRFKLYGFIFLFLNIFFLLTGATGRATLITALALAILYTFKLKLKYVITASIAASIFLLPIILNMKGIIFNISVNKEFPNLIEIYANGYNTDSFINNFGHPLISLLKIDNLIELIGYRYFYDYIQGFIFYLKIVGLPVSDSLLYYNTQNLLGIRESVIPTGYLAFGYIQFSYFGVIISGITFRLIGLITEKIFYKISTKDNEMMKFYTVYLAASTFYHGEFRVMTLSFFLPLLILYILPPKKLIKTNNLKSNKYIKYSSSQ